MQVEKLRAQLQAAGSRRDSLMGSDDEDPALEKLRGQLAALEKENEELRKVCICLGVVLSTCCFVPWLPCLEHVAALLRQVSHMCAHMVVECMGSAQPIPAMQSSRAACSHAATGMGPG